jgi:hypothetical protein
VFNEHGRKLMKMLDGYAESGKEFDLQVRWVFGICVRQIKSLNMISFVSIAGGILSLHT